MAVTFRQDRRVSAAMEVLKGRRSIKKCRAETNTRSRLTIPSLCIFSDRTRSFPPVSSENELAKVAQSDGWLRPPRARLPGLPHGRRRKRSAAQPARTPALAHACPELISIRIKFLFTDKRPSIENLQCEGSFHENRHFILPAPRQLFPPRKRSTKPFFLLGSKD